MRVQEANATQLMARAIEEFKRIGAAGPNMWGAGSNSTSLKGIFGNCEMLEGVHKSTGGAKLVWTISSPMLKGNSVIVLKWVVNFKYRGAGSVVTNLYI